VIAARTLRERRLIAVALLLAAIAAVDLGVVRPIIDGFSHRAAEREQLIDAQARAHRLIASEGTWRERRRVQALDASAFSVAAPSADVAVEAAEQRIADAVSSQGGQVRGVREEPSPAGAVRVRADLELTLTQLVASLNVIENQKPYVVIEQLSIAADQAAAVGRLSPMEVTLEVAVPYVAPAG
jgi:Type II secretion system (T2SS), protein M subtype b